LGTDDIGALDGIATEEDGEVQANDIVVALLGVELDGESTRVTGLVGELTAESDSGETHEDGSLLANSGQEVGLGQIRNILGHLEVTEGTTTARVYHSCAC
jgi:hypothetical protein